jgi:nitrate/TMAO reductase-like tetraheme cytochrome c subunit
MNKNRLLLLIAITCGVTLVAAGATDLYAQAKPKQDPIILKGSPLGGVKFEHQKHLDRMGAEAAKNCETCHHASKPEKASTSPQQSCQSCHTSQVKPPMKTNAAGAFHKSPMAPSGVCVDCHKAENAKGKKAPVAPKCIDCHKKENT